MWRKRTFRKKQDGNQSNPFMERYLFRKGVTPNLIILSLIHNNQEGSSPCFCHRWNMWSVVTRPGSDHHYRHHPPSASWLCIVYGVTEQTIWSPWGLTENCQPGFLRAEHNPLTFRQLTFTWQMPMFAYSPGATAITICQTIDFNLRQRGCFILLTAWTTFANQRGGRCVGGTGTLSQIVIKILGKVHYGFSKIII